LSHRKTQFFGKMYVLINKHQQTCMIFNDAKQVAEEIGVSPSTIYNWLNKPDINDYIENLEYIIIRNPIIIKSNRGGRNPHPFTKKEQK
jgi:hypothetical protein